MHIYLPCKNNEKKSLLTFHMFLTTVKFICEMLFENLLSLFYPALQDTFQALHKVVVVVCVLCESPDPTIA